MAKKKEGFFESIKNLINSGTQSINQSQFFIAIVMLLMCWFVIDFPGRPFGSFVSFALLCARHLVRC